MRRIVLVVTARARQYLGYYSLPVVVLGVAVCWATYDIVSGQFPLVGIVLTAFGLVALFGAIGEQRKDRRRRHLQANGDRGTARIQGLSLTGKSSKGLAYEIELLVSTDAHGEYEKTIRESLRHDKLAMVELGATLAVRVDHEDREQLVVDWSARPQVRTRPHRRQRRTAQRRFPRGS